MYITAQRFIRKMRGGSQAHLLAASDGNAYVVKFVNNPQHRRVLINEWIASAMLRHLGIQVPMTRVIEVSQQFLEANKEVHFQVADGRSPVTPGLHFASRCPGDQKLDAVFDFLPDKLLYRCTNLADFVGVFVFDKWLAQTDSRQAIFHNPRRTERLQHVEAQMVDNGDVFGGGKWRFDDSQLRAPYFRTQVYASVTGPDDFEPWLKRVRSFPRQIIDDTIRSIPIEWMQDDQGHLQGLVDRLFERRGALTELIELAHRANRELFGNWPSGRADTFHGASMPLVRPEGSKTGAIDLRII